METLPRWLPVIVALLGVAGCANVPTQEEANAAYYGPPVSKSEFEMWVRTEMGFFDPYSAVISCTQPRKAGADHLWTKRYGWLAHCTYNAKNKFGGYVGEEQVTLLLSGGEMLEILMNEYRYVE